MSRCTDVSAIAGGMEANQEIRSSGWNLDENEIRNALKPNNRKINDISNKKQIFHASTCA